MIFITGHHNTGKTTLANWLKSLGFVHVETGEIVRSVFKNLRGNNMSFGDWATEVSHKDPNFFDDCVLKELERISSLTNDTKRIVITGNRQISGIEYLIKNFKSEDNRILFLVAPTEKLFDRQLKREDRKIAGLTFEIFKNDYLAFDDKMGVEEIREYSDYVIDASRDIVQIREDVLDIIKNDYKLETHMKTEADASLTVPCHWDREIMQKILDQQGEVRVGEVYGSLADGGPVGHGRAKSSVGSISKEEAVAFRQWLAEKGINFTYLLNAPFEFKDEQHEKEVREYITWIIRDLKPSALTITSLELMRFVRKIDPDINIHISTIAGVRNVDDLKQYLEIKPNRVVPHHDIGKRWADLSALAEFSKQNGIEVELLATESCVFKCPLRDSHYLHLAKRCEDDKFHTNCNLRKINHPREFLLSGGMIRPEDMDFYENMGVKYFKITGRSKPSSWLPEVVKAYSERSFEGNLIRLLGIDPSLKAEDWIFIDNKSLDGFIENFPQTENEDDENKYTDKWMVGLYNESKLKFFDGTRYTVENDELRLMERGTESNKIAEAESPFKIKIR